MKTLTGRELIIIDTLIWNDKDSREQVADKLNISINTLNNHLDNIYKKLDINNIAALVKWYFLTLCQESKHYPIYQCYDRIRRAIFFFIALIVLTSIIAENCMVRAKRAKPAVRCSRAVRARTRSSRKKTLIIKSLKKSA